MMSPGQGQDRQASTGDEVARTHAVTHDHPADDGHRHDEHDHEHADHGHTHGDHDHDHDGGPLGFLTSLFRPHSHDAADSVDDALAGSEEGIRAVKWSLLGLGVTALLQLVVVWLSGSVALLADTIHNFADASTAIPLWIAFSVGRRPPTRRYTYGYGRAEDLAGVFIVLMITGSAALAGWESVQKLVDPQPMNFVGWVAAAGLIGFLGNEAVAQYRIRTGQRIGSAALVADGYHARTDGLTSLAVLLAAGGAWFGYPLADPIVGLCITVAILFVLKDAVLQVWRRLMDAVEPELLERAEAAAAQAEGVQAVTQIRARWIGHSIVAEVRLVADRDLKLSEAHAVAERARHAMLHAVPKLTDVNVHMDPCTHAGGDPHADLSHHDRRPVNPSEAPPRPASSDLPAGHRH
ncbi:MAG: cation diffusion facilitator family transporter [Chloroflexota bacterium]